jgi:hypothetical protein
MRTLSLLAAVALSPSLLAQAPSPPGRFPLPPWNPIPVQQPAAQAPSTTVLPPVILKAVPALEPPGNKNCPVALSARHSRDSGVVQVSPGSEPHRQGYSIGFKPLGPRSVEQARITLHGMSGAHVVPVKDHPADATESFTVSPSAGPNHLFQSVVYLDKLTGVQWIEINELTFADGTAWHESANSFCRVTPNGFMLVGATAH